MRWHLGLSHLGHPAGTGSEHLVRRTRHLHPATTALPARYLMQEAISSYTVFLIFNNFAFSPCGKVRTKSRSLQRKAGPFNTLHGSAEARHTSAELSLLWAVQNTSFVVQNHRHETPSSMGWSAGQICWVHTSLCPWAQDGPSRGPRCPQPGTVLVPRGLGGTLLSHSRDTDPACVSIVLPAPPC